MLFRFFFQAEDGIRDIGVTGVQTCALPILGIPAQALLGGVTVLTGLNPWTVAAHFLLSMVLVALATVLWLRSREPGVGGPLLRRPLALLVGGIADRKSTRLNSSHANISYAVFCLKKKDTTSHQPHSPAITS